MPRPKRKKRKKRKKRPKLEKETTQKEIRKNEVSVEQVGDKFVNDVHAEYVMEHVDGWKINKKRNFAKYDVEDIKKIKHMIADKPVLVIGSDDSFYSTLGEIKKLPLDEFVIICVDEVYRNLVDTGIEPDFVVHMNQKSAKYAYYKTSKPTKTIGLFSILSRQKDVDSWQGEKYWYCPYVAPEIGDNKIVEECEGVLMHVDTCYNEKSAAIFIAHYANAGAIIVAGMDFASFVPDMNAKNRLELTMSDGTIRYTSMKGWADYYATLRMLEKYKIKIIDIGNGILEGNRVNKMSVNQLKEVCADFVNEESGAGVVSQPVDPEPETPKEEDSDGT